jgi:exosortase D (VPLPA-CTERM-specific)
MKASLPGARQDPTARAFARLARTGHKSFTALPVSSHYPQTAKRIVVNYQPSNRIERSYTYHFPPWTLLLFLLLAVLVYACFARAIVFMVGQWSLDEFSDGYLIPFISLFLIWQRRKTLQRLEFKGSWSGLAIVVAGLALDVVGRLSSIYTVQHIALLVVIAGIVLALAGWHALRVIGAPLGVLVFMIPLPNFLLTTLSAQLQLISSSFAVWMMRLAGVAVLLQGNVIDLGSYKLEVAEACSGLRYLLPLMTLAFLMACFYRMAFWKRAVLFLSSIPLTLMTNSVRIALIGVMVDRWGTGMAEGLLHEVQGWMMFMLSTIVLVLELMWLSRLGRERRPWRTLLGPEVQIEPQSDLPRRPRRLSAPLLVCAATVMLFSAAAFAMPVAVEQVPARASFTTFPLQFGHWSGRRQALQPVYLDTLKLDDYLLADYVGTDHLPVNLYVAWYNSQSPGDSAHSPKACLPGGGWRIDDLRQVRLAGVSIDSRKLRVNRALIQYGDQRQLVYYWFEERGRVLTNEYLVKWYLLVDAVFKHRTDGALVRLIVPMAPGMSAKDADRELQRFLTVVAPRLSPYIPG